MARKIIIFDTTLRDGEQAPGVNLNTTEKLKTARQLERLGVDYIEAGFPATSEGDFEAVRAIAGMLKTSGVAALCRSVPGDIDTGWEALRGAVQPRIHVFIATSPIHMEYKLKLTEDEVVERAVAAVRHAKKYVSDVEFSCEDGSRSKPEFLYRIIEAVIAAGATTVNVPDTVGYAMMAEYGALIRGIIGSVPNIDRAVLSVHTHDDLGIAAATSLAGIYNGAGQVECTINGIGERAGNASLEEIVMALGTRRDFWDCETGVDTRQIYRTSKLVSSLTGMDIPLNKAIVGKNAFRHESGIHQHGVMQNPLTYEIMSPEDIGLVKSPMVLGKHSGRHAFAERLSEMGFGNMSSEDIDSAFHQFKALCDRKKDVSDADIEAIAHNKSMQADPTFALDSFTVQSGNKTSSMASVLLLRGDQSIHKAAVGDGPVSALLSAVDEAIAPIEVSLKSYSLRAVTEGADALGEVTVRIECGGNTYVGKGISTDVLDSSVQAYVSAINRALM